MLSRTVLRTRNVSSRTSSAELQLTFSHRQFSSSLARKTNGYGSPKTPEEQRKTQFLYAMALLAAAGGGWWLVKQRDVSGVGSVIDEGCAESGDGLQADSEESRADL